jgi:hypothetical protein
MRFCLPSNLAIHWGSTTPLGSEHTAAKGQLERNAAKTSVPLAAWFDWVIWLLFT